MNDSVSEQVVGGLHTEAHGDLAERPLLLLHGFASHFERNWVRTGWLRALRQVGFSVLGVDMPAHGRSVGITDPARCLPSAVMASIRDVLDHYAVQHVDVIGYSLGARMAWELPTLMPDRIGRLVVGGLPFAEPFSALDIDAVRAYLRSAETVRDPFTAYFVRLAESVPGNDLSALVEVMDAVRAEPFDASVSPPTVPTLVVCGTADKLALSASEPLATLTGGSPVLIVGRDHDSAVSAIEFKTAAIRFLTER